MNLINQIESLIYSGNSAAIENLQKAIEVNPGQLGATATTSPDNQKREFISELVTRLTASQNDIQFTKLLDVDYSQSLTYQFTRETSVGNTGMLGMFSQQSEVKSFDPALFDRHVTQLAFSFDKKNIGLTTLSENMAPALGNDPEATYIQRAVLAMNLRENKAYAMGNKSIDPLGIDGVFEWHKYDFSTYTKKTPAQYKGMEQVVDLRGAQMNYDHINNGDGILQRNYSSAPIRFMVMPNIAIDGLNRHNVMGATQFDDMGSKEINKLSTFVPGITTSHGRSVMFKNDIFISRETIFGVWKINDASQNVIDGAPGVPTGVDASAVSDTADSLFASGDAGTYFYAVSAVNSAGMSKLALVKGSSVTVAAGESVDLQFTANGAGVATTGYVIWRSLKNAVDSTGNFYPIGTVSAIELQNGYDGAAATKVRDRNRTLPGTVDVFMVESNDTGTKINPSILRRLELDPSKPLGGVKILQTPLSVTLTNKQTAILHAIGMAMGAPTKVIVFRNVKASL